MQRGFALVSYNNIVCAGKCKVTLKPVYLGHGDRRTWRIKRENGAGWTMRATTVVTDGGHKDYYHAPTLGGLSKILTGLSAAWGLLPLWLVEYTYSPAGSIGDPQQCVGAVVVRGTTEALARDEAVMEAHRIRDVQHVHIIKCGPVAT